MGYDLIFKRRLRNTDTYRLIEIISCHREDFKAFLELIEINTLESINDFIISGYIEQ
jgi:hypothetical protein